MALSLHFSFPFLVLSAPLSQLVFISFTAILSSTLLLRLLRTSFGDAPFVSAYIYPNDFIRPLLFPFIDFISSLCVCLPGGFEARPIGR